VLFINKCLPLAKIIVHQLGLSTYTPHLSEIRAGLTSSCYHIKKNTPMIFDQNNAMLHDIWIISIFKPISKEAAYFVQIFRKPLKKLIIN
jgi:hypothetical protein